MKTSGIIAALLLSVVAGAGFASAHFGVFDSTEHDTLQTAIKNNDFAAWQAAGASLFTQERFDAEREHFTTRKAMDDAITANDYQAYTAAVTAMEANKPEGASAHPVLSETDFNTLVQIQAARAAGDDATARTLSEQLGFGHGGRGHSRGGFGMHGARAPVAAATE